MKYVVTVEGKTFEIEVDREGQRVWVDHQPYDVDLRDVGGIGQYSLLLNHRSYEAHVEQNEEEGCQLVVAGRPYQAFLQRNQSRSEGGPATATRHESTNAEVCAPLPGRLVEMRVAEGEQVKEKDVVAVLESMKMNLELRAPQSGVISALSGTAGQEVDQGEVLAVIEPDAESKEE